MTEVVRFLKFIVLIVITVPLIYLVQAWMEIMRMPLTLLTAVSWSALTLFLIILIYIDVAFVLQELKK